MLALKSILTAALGLLFVSTTLAQEREENYSEIFAGDYQRVIKYLQTEKGIDSIIRLHQLNPKEVVATIVPELIRDIEKPPGDHYSQVACKTNGAILRSPVRQTVKGELAGHRSSTRENSSCYVFLFGLRISDLAAFISGADSPRGAKPHQPLAPASTRSMRAGNPPGSLAVTLSLYWLVTVPTVKL